MYTALTRAPEKLLDWDKLTDMLKDFMADQSETSYLSMERVAKFWRKLVERFPELVEFLAVTDEETRDHFNSVAKTLFQDFYLKKKVEPLPLHKILNWRDRAPLAQWLAMAQDSDRRFFTSFMTDLIRIARGNDAAQPLEIKMKHSGKDTAFQERMSASRKLTKRQLTILREIEEGRDPLSHSSVVQTFGGAATAVRAALAIRDCASNRGEGGAGVMMSRAGLSGLFARKWASQVNNSQDSEENGSQGDDHLCLEPKAGASDEDTHNVVEIDYQAAENNQILELAQHPSHAKEAGTSGCEV